MAARIIFVGGNTMKAVDAEQRMQILIAEDDLVSRRLLKKTLEDFGYDVLDAEDGDRAWDIVQGEDIKLVVADWMMPGMNGIELCRRIRASQSLGYVYFILLTGKDKKEDIVAGLDAGADDYLVKPFERAELRVRVGAGKRIINLEKELTDKNKKLEEMVCIDSLTGIFNRRNFYHAVEKLHERTCRYGQIYGMVMCDIDYFKSYNDTYGHLMGDVALKKVADSIKDSCRNSDEVFRFGGEEIVVLLPEQDCKKSVVAAERIRKGIESLGIVHKGSDKGVLTISCGVAAFDKEERNDKWEAVLDRADKGLYKAKADGRNKVCVY